MKREELVFNLSLLAVMVLMLVINLDYRPGARRVPMLIGICTVGLFVAINIQFFKRTTQKDESGNKKKRHSEDKPPDLETMLNNDNTAYTEKKKDAVIITWLLFLTAASYLIGFLIAIPLYMFLFLFVYAKESWKTSIGMSIGVFAVIYLVFVKVLNVNLYKGLLI